MWGPESLFQPITSHMIDAFTEFEGLHRSISDSALKCDPDIRLQLFKNVILSGGTTMLDGIRERTKRELSILCS